MTEIDESELTGAGERGATVDGLAEGVKRTIDAAVLPVTIAEQPHGRSLPSCDHRAIARSARRPS